MLLTDRFIPLTYGGFMKVVCLVLHSNVKTESGM
jgi:hypothetical protein